MQTIATTSRTANLAAFTETIPGKLLIGLAATAVVAAGTYSALYHPKRIV